MHVSLEYNELNPHFEIGKFMRSYYMSQRFVISLSVAENIAQTGSACAKNTSQMRLLLGGGDSLTRAFCCN